jgi:hypothetical protein
VRSRAGSREFDFNTDGLAHIGLLPDFLRDLVHVGMTDAQLDPLFSSADAFLRMWESCEARSAAIVGGELADAAIPRLAMELAPKRKRSSPAATGSKPRSKPRRSGR